jgi:hypothetical protein
VSLADDLRHAWKWFSVQLGALIMCAPEVYEHADILQDLMPAKAFHHVMAALGILVILNSVRKKAK